MPELAFCLFKFFPYGGLQQDFLRLARTCLDRGHRVKVFTGSWQGPLPESLEVILIPARGLTNHHRAVSFARQFVLDPYVRSCDTVVGFNKMPGLDFYFASDTCFAAKAYSRSAFYRATPRCRAFLRLERAVFDNSSSTEILLLSEQEKEHFIRHYGTVESRFHLLPPGIPRDRIAPPDAGDVRARLRSELGFDENRKIVLMVGSGFKTKGVDRAVVAISSLPGHLREKTVLLVVGHDKPRPYRALARRLGIGENVFFTGGRHDVPRFLVAADLLLHPAYTENTGTVLVEAMASGLPVLATDICGYSRYVVEARAGRLVPSPFKQEDLNTLLSSMLTSADQGEWKENGIHYVMRNDVFSLHERAAEIIEKAAL